MENEYKKIEASFDHVITAIKEGNIYKKYISLKEEMEKNSKINEMIREIKTLQKQAVKKEVNGDSSSQEDQKIKEILEKLDQIPLYLEYKEIQHELDEELLLVKTNLNQYIESIES